MFFRYYYKKPSFSYDISSPTLSSPNMYSSSSSYYTDYNQFSLSFDHFDRNDGIPKKRNYNKYDDEDDYIEDEEGDDEEEEEEEEEEILSDKDISEDTDDDDDTNELINITYLTRAREKNINNNNENNDFAEKEDISDNDSNDDDNDMNIDKKHIGLSNSSTSSFVIDINSPQLFSMAFSKGSSAHLPQIDDEILFKKFKNIGIKEEEEEEEKDDNQTTDRQEDQQLLQDLHQHLQRPFPSILKGMVLFIYTHPRDREDIYHQKVKEIITRHVIAYDGRVTRTITDADLTHILLINEKDQSLISVFSTNITIISLDEFLSYIAKKLK
ncbi:hypothetical protein PIROE2DRAFT_5601 [Piromyces sp. E2]|nr:hypothetical protein PIROE2DRAFT_5601 [Piromyces sp. E2]|eukprot:OUM66998.1 hypothetical protein PIROE2DRAFT_5601 [Piromyces sp. E2]